MTEDADLASREAGDAAQQLGPCAAEAAAIAERLEDSLGGAAEPPEDNAKQAFVEVFVGGLPPDASDDAVEAAFAAVGAVLTVRLNRRKKTGECKGFGFIRFADQATAERACLEVKEACGKPVGVHISRARSAEQAAEERNDLLSEDCDPETGVNKLLKLIRGHSDKRAAIAAALKAVLSVPSKPKPGTASDRLAEKSSRSEDALDAEGKSRAREEAALPDPATFLEGFPRCKHLVDTFRTNPNTHNKTPLAILHEYATRLSLELIYNESADSNLGPFTVEAKLTSIGGAVLYATGEGRGRGKKDAKQVAAAAVLEMLLANVPESDFLQPGKAKILKVQVTPRSTLAATGRSGLVPRGRGRGRWVLGRSGRPLDFPGPAVSSFPGASHAVQDFSQYKAYQSPQELYENPELYNFAAAQPLDGKTRSLAAAQPDAEVLRGLRGHSLDTLTSIQRQLAGLSPLGQEAPLGLYGNSRSFDNSSFTVGVMQDADGTVLLQNQPVHNSLAAAGHSGPVGNLGIPHLGSQQVPPVTYGLQGQLQQFPRY